ncbi:unnamed protein product [Durusdinium trenchii]
MYDGDFFVPVIRLDLLERDQLPLPNTWREVLDLAHRYNGADLNEDGLPDFGMCHFPREGAGYFDWWWPELMYAIWATYAQVEDTSQGFLFDPKTLEPKLKGPAFQAAIDFMKEMWQDGSEGCISDSFSTGRCAIGFSPPGCWKGIFLNGVARRSSNGTVLWEPKMLDGSYAEPYRFKPFGTTQVEKDGILEECTPAMCPFAETIPLRGHHGNDDRARILPASPLAGKLINRAPFFWSGGLGIVIRKSAPKELKDMLWDWMVYTKRVETSAKDVASYASWLDSWRFTQLTPDGQYFLNAGWSEVAYQEHRSIMHWALGTDSNGAFNLRLPGAKTYTKTVLASAMELYISGAVQRDEVLERVENGWMAETQRRGILDQLAIYRAALGLTPMEDPELCQLHREAMDRVDPAVCRRFDPVTEFYLIALIALGSLLVAGTLCSCAIFVWHTNHAKKKLLKEKEANLDSTVTRGLATVSELGYPMAIISAQDFMKVTMEELASCHEGLRDIGYLRVLDTTEEISHFHDMGNVIVFFSYHWPSWERLGPDLQQRHAMDHSLKLYSEQVGHSMECIWVWLDIISIPQKHPGIQLLAINSLYVYAYSVDALIIIAPPTVQEQTGEALGLESYKNRVWTRVEQVAHLFAHGTDSLYVYEPEGLKGVDAQWLAEVVHVFAGQTTCCDLRHENFDVCDRESLVLPLLGLYYRVAAAERRGVDQNEGTKTLYDMIEANREKIFPRSFDYACVIDGQEALRKRTLFGDLLERVDKHLAQFDVATIHDRIHHQSSLASSAKSLRASPGGRCYGGVGSATLSSFDDHSPQSPQVGPMSLLQMEMSMLELPALQEVTGSSTEVEEHL